MNIIKTVTIIFVSLVLLLGILFIGSITGQAIRGDLYEFSGTEFVIILAVVLICVQVAIISFKRSDKKEVDIKELIKQVQYS